MFKTIRKSFRLIGLEELSDCYSALTEIYQQYRENKDLVIAVTIDVMDRDKARTVAQNSLYWMWVTIIAEATGLSKDDQHTDLKRNHLARIYARDDPEFAEMALSLRMYKRLATPEEYAPLARGVAALMSTTKATTRQMTEYLNDIDKYYYAQGLVLPKPDDYMWIMGDESGGSLRKSGESSGNVGSEIYH